uniref:Xrn1 N-terminal domain-containing protein n=1 Tax=viral metagenome TaxID=1070528 RepID=A0A6C0EAE4_9ZZZZ
MGIDNFYKHIKENYNDSFKKKWLKQYDYIHIDLNYMLHSLLYTAKSQEDLLDKLDNAIEIIATYNIPSKGLFLYADGTSPLSKLMLQRQRRLCISRSDKELELSSLNFTVGTKFMNNLEKRLEYTIKKIKYLFCIDVKCHISDHDEAEIKIKREILKLNHDDTHLLVTSDADVVVMMMTLKSYKNIYIIIRSKQEYIILSLGKLLTLHTAKYGKTKTSNMDFSFLSLFLGNDYIPKIKFVNQNSLWESYKTYCKDYENGLCDDKLKINLKFLEDILMDISFVRHNSNPNKIHLSDIENKICSDYLHGIMWCIDMYTNGRCHQYNYMYEYSDAPHPFALMLTIQLKKCIRFKEIKYKPIKKELYGILILPKSAKALIDKKYHDFIDKNQDLYTEEMCSKCNELLKQGSDSRKEYLKHKKEHCPLTFLDIQEIIDKFNKIYMNNI